MNAAKKEEKEALSTESTEQKTPIQDIFYYEETERSMYICTISVLLLSACQYP